MTEKLTEVEEAVLEAAKQMHLNIAAEHRAQMAGQSKEETERKVQALIAEFRKTWKDVPGIWEEGAWGEEQTKGGMTK